MLHMKEDLNLYWCRSNHICCDSIDETILYLFLWN